MSERKSESSPALAALTASLDLEQLEDNLFRGASSESGWQRVYGGQVLGQCLVAAGRTVTEPRPLHSMHGYFLLAGDPRHPIVYEVERTRDGGSFSTRRVKAIQHGQTIFVMGASYHRPEPGYDHAATMPDVPPPEQLKSSSELFAGMIDRLPENMRSYWKRERPVEMRPVDLARYLDRGKREPIQHIWMRTTGTLPDDPNLHASVLAYASDFTLLDTALISHGKLLFDDDLQLASLDHALWFHRAFRADEWLLYSQDSPSASAARGFCRGSVYDRRGRLVASVAQEGLIRLRRTNFVIK